MSVRALGGHRNQSDPLAVTVGKVTGVMNDDVLAPMADVHRQQHLDDTGREAIESVQDRRRSMRGCAFGSAVETRRHHLLVPRPRARGEPEDPGRESFDDPATREPTHRAF